MPWYARLAWVWCLVLGVLAYSVVLQAMVATRNLNLFPTLLLIGALTVPLAVLLLTWAVGAQGRGASGIVTLTAVFGGVIGTTSAGVLEYATLKQLPWTGMLAVGVIEEAVKLIAPVVVFLVIGRRRPDLGVVIGVASGTGFAVLETMGYGLTALVATQGNLAAVEQTLLLRALLSPAGHVAWTGLTCFALWRMGQTGRKYAGLGFAGAYLLAVLLHAVWDGTASLLVHVVLAALSSGILITLIVVSARSGRRAP
ncbi:MAG: PrsW family glutamic-type intramembrane protease [Propionibacteriaceae bacterium]|nr:PrsW family glutamic-type intramembrane protease [Propionibacteriaceae bacterium]